MLRRKRTNHNSHSSNKKIIEKYGESQFSAVSPIENPHKMHSISSEFDILFHPPTPFFCQFPLLFAHFSRFFQIFPVPQKFWNNCSSHFFIRNNLEAKPKKKTKKWGKTDKWTLKRMKKNKNEKWEIIKFSGQEGTPVHLLTSILIFPLMRLHTFPPFF